MTKHYVKDTFKQNCFMKYKYGKLIFISKKLCDFKYSS